MRLIYSHQKATKYLQNNSQSNDQNLLTLDFFQNLFFSVKNNHLS